MEFPSKLFKFDPLYNVVNTNHSTAYVCRQTAAATDYTVLYESVDAEAIKNV